MKNLLFITLLFLPIYSFSSSGYLETKQSFCKIKTPRKIEVLEERLKEKNCQKGDIVSWVTGNADFGYILQGRICDFRYQIHGEGNTTRGNTFCHYIGYIRQDR